MLYTNICSNIIVYQKYIGTSIKVDYASRSLYASSGPKAEGVPTNNQRGRASGPCRFWGGLDKTRHIVLTAFLVRVQRLRNDLYNAVQGPRTRPIVLSMITGSSDFELFICHYFFNPTISMDRFYIVNHVDTMKMLHDNNTITKQIHYIH